MCSASHDKQWLEEFVIQITVLNDREFSLAKQKLNSIQEGSRIENELYNFTQTNFSTYGCWTRIAQMAATPCDVPGPNPGTVSKIKVLFLEIDSFWKLPQLSKRTCDYFTKINIIHREYSACFRIFRHVSNAGFLSPRRFVKFTSPLVQQHVVSHTHHASYIFHVSSGDCTTVEMNAIEQTLNDSCFLSVFLGFRIPNPITGLSGWRTPD